MIQELTLPEIATSDRHSIKRGPFGGALKKDIFVDKGYVVYEQQHAIYKRFNDIRYFIDESKYKELVAFKVEEGDLIISCSGTIGKIAEVPKGFKPGIINQALLKLTLDQSKVLNKYFLYLFEGEEIQNQLFNLSHGTGLKNFPPMSVVKSIKFPLPPLDQQKKIAAILDAADAYRQKTKALITKYDELTQSLFLDMFGDPVRNPMGWEKVALNELCDFKKTSVKPEEIETGDTYIGLECIEKQTGKILERFIVEAGEIKSNKFWFDSNYILYGKLRPYLNKVANPDFEGVCSTDIIPIRPILKNTAKEFIISLLRGSWFVSFADERCSGANLPRISPKEVEKYQTINPPIKLQNQFAERVQAIESQKAQAQVSLAHAEDLFNSLLQRAFKGELTS